jgi:hypothetical protein
VGAVEPAARDPQRIPLCHAGKRKPPITLLRLPLYNILSVDEQAEIVRAIHEFSVGEFSVGESRDLARLALAVYGTLIRLMGCHEQIVSTSPP